MEETGKSLMDTDLNEKVIKHMTPLEKNMLEKYVLDLYLKGIKPKKAIPLILLECPNIISYAYASKFYQLVRANYLNSTPFLPIELAQKEAIQEMEDLEEEINDNVKPGDVKKYSVLLDTKKHKHTLLGIGVNNPNIEINITSDVDGEFLKSQNKVIDVESLSSSPPTSPVNKEVSSPEPEEQP